VNSRKQVVLRALAAGVAAGVIVSAVMVWRQRSLVPPPKFPIMLPENVSWANRSVTRMPDGTERILIEAFVGDGRNYRLEVALVGKPPVVFVFDGKDLQVNVEVPKKTPAEIDPRNTILGAYDTLPAFRYLGTKKIGDHLCWAFQQVEKGIGSRFWVDVETRVPRQIMLSYPDGRRDTQVYVDLPLHRTRQPGLFDTKKLGPMLVTSARAMLDER
jgi:hypothetical protein